MIEFKDPDILYLMDQLKKSSTSEQRCLVSRVDINDENSVVLPCGHWYHVDYYKGIKKKRKCPYCGQSFEPDLLERPCTVCGTLTELRNTKCVKHNQKKCQHILTCGKNKGSHCKNHVSDTLFCRRHTVK